MTSKKFLSEWKREEIRCFVTRFNSVATYKKPGRSLFIRSRFLRAFWANISNLKIFKNAAHYWMHPHTARHFEALRLLKTLDPDAWAYLLGSRDLVFQISPLIVASELKKKSTLHFFDEDGYYFKDGQPQYTKFSEANSMWTAQLFNFNKTKASYLDSKVIINADCIFGKVSELIQFLEQSCQLLAASHYSTFALLDQASTNYVAHKLIDEGLAALHNNGSFVLNMCGIVDATHEIKEGVLTLNSEIVPIVHQFDRYGIWNFNSGLTLNKRSYKVQI